VESFQAELLAARTSEEESLQAVLAARTRDVEFWQDKLQNAASEEEVESFQAELLAARTSELHARVESLEAVLATRTRFVVSLQAELDKRNCAVCDKYSESRVDLLEALLAARISEVESLQTVLAARVESLQAVLDTRTSEVELLKAAQGNLTCGEVKSSYNASGCCRSAGGQPENRFTFVDGR
jgi:hypothetical protein